MLEHRERDLGDLAPARPDRVEDVRPVPPVERRVRDQRLQAVAERQRRHDEGDGQHRPEQRRAHGHGGPALTGLERHPDPDHPGGRQPGPRRGRHDPCPRRRADVGAGAPPGAAPSRRPAGRRRRSAGRRRVRTPRPRTVQSKESPLVGIDRSARGRAATAGRARRQRPPPASIPSSDRRLQADQAVEDGVGRVRAQRPEDPQVVAVDAEPARDQLGRDRGARPGGPRCRRPPARWRSA